MTAEPTVSFAEALASGNLDRLAAFPKSDLHSHGTLAGRLSDLSRRLGRVIPAPERLDGVHGLMAWTARTVHPVYASPGGVELLLGLALEQAKRDGVVRLEMSVEATLIEKHPGRARGLAESLERLHRAIAPEVALSPELGLKRHLDPARLEDWLSEALETGGFRGIDLYGDEKARPCRELRSIFERAARAGLYRKAHVGELGTAGDVQEAVETLGLNAVQHGIAAADSPEVMRFLADHRIPLHVCPSSNVLLGMVESLERHPIRRLFDAGVRVTVNTDDVLLFDRSVSQEYLALFRAGVFTAVELETIRGYGLNA